MFTNCITTIIFCCVTHLYVQKLIEQCAVSFQKHKLFLLLKPDCTLLKYFLQYKSATQPKFNQWIKAGPQKNSTLFLSAFLLHSRRRVLVQVPFYNFLLHLLCYRLCSKLRQDCRTFRHRLDK